MSTMNRPQPSEAQIRLRAYEIYAARGQQSCNEVDDWITAEKELIEQGVATEQKTKAAKAG